MHIINEKKVFDLSSISRSAPGAGLRKEAIVKPMTPRVSSHTQRIALIASDSCYSSKRSLKIDPSYPMRLEKRLCHVVSCQVVSNPPLFPKTFLHPISSYPLSQINQSINQSPQPPSSSYPFPPFLPPPPPHPPHQSPPPPPPAAAQFQSPPSTQAAYDSSFATSTSTSTSK